MIRSAFVLATAAPKSPVAPWVMRLDALNRLTALPMRSDVDDMNHAAQLLVDVAMMRTRILV